MIETLNNERYVIDMSRLMAWVAKTPSSEKNITTLITETYPMQTDEGEGFEAATKEISESKTTLNEVMNNIRYDLAKQLIQPLLEYNDSSITNFEDLTFSQKLCFNSLLNEGIIKEVNN